MRSSATAAANRSSSAPDASPLSTTVEPLTSPVYTVSASWFRDSSRTWTSHGTPPTSTVAVAGTASACWASHVGLAMDVCTRPMKLPCGVAQPISQKGTPSAAPPFHRA